MRLVSFLSSQFPSSWTDDLNNSLKMSQRSYEELHVQQWTITAHLQTANPFATVTFMFLEDPECVLPITVPFTGSKVRFIVPHSVINALDLSKDAQVILIDFVNNLVDFLEHNEIVKKFGGVMFRIGPSKKDLQSSIKDQMKNPVPSSFSRAVRQHEKEFDVN